MSLQIKNILFHGTISEIQHVDVSLGHGRKDFAKASTWRQKNHRLCP